MGSRAARSSFVALLLVPGFASAQVEVAPGITYAGDDAGVHVLDVALDHPQVTFEVSEPEMRGLTVSEYATQRGATVSLNGGPFSIGSFAPEGLTVGSGRRWAGSRDDGEHALLAVDIDGCGGIYPTAVHGARERWMYHAVGGTAVVVTEGIAVSPRCDGDGCASRAQSAVGLSSDGRRMLLVAVEEATPTEVGELLASRGAWVGMLLDGGPSTAMFVGEELVNRPSDGVERRVGSHIGVFSGRGPRWWDVRGVVTGQPEVDVEIRTFWDQRIDGRRTVPWGGNEGDGLFQFMPVPYRNVRIVTPDRCLFTGFTGPEDVRLDWWIEPGSTCPPAECTRVAEAAATTEPTCTEAGGGAAAAWPVLGGAILALGVTGLVASRRRS
ncbi:MAG: phosphodiester glycosidase family protein [Deltaproteobacteria bacterium]|nr:phosphodiester glycosidase family protein [Deltaproteobacteria bacterium]